ncbi:MULTISPECIES: exodeoxyribonuclease V subunit alpha [unclassified Gilliamella]|uniref:exodeoxyribonuclease V subunit alpha n=1 Tax=unclassified Gilliamella TaxID=2685620 RepID=UPI00130998E1|nr:MULTISPECIES: exodeoxyribonuclease V subunit alpha [unclassified Gilliamella]MWP49831.1 exodeoxyribonuclease V subunit alpha [Gilliamella sp. Lep-s35]MWP69686.1 exodeoxyribonuclease V subunit alpha [Gilliamella sp. Lep-s5]MWP77836.1 exodeoxyribonuclease V subunit alpha [Gilliamella sp. Lep-s21]
MLNEWLNQFKQDSQISLLDIHLATFLTNKAMLNDDITTKRFSFLVLSLSKEVRSGHVCLDLTLLTPPAIDTSLWLALASPNEQDWRLTLEQASHNQVVSDGTNLSPLVFIENKLYFQRMWLDETNVAQYFNHTTFSEQPSYYPDLSTILNQLFTQQQSQTDWQKVAVAAALTRKVAIISGGPGTGKTTTVAKILAGVLLTNPNARIVTAAPTGKAASRLTESLSRTIEQLNFASLNLKAEAITLHRLLGAKADNSSFTHNKNNPLHIDVLVIDEASMVDLNMMARVIEALPILARLILLGDKDQLSSVEAGAVFGDLCTFITQGYSQPRAKELSQLTGYNVPACEQTATITDSICLLQKSYRFNESSGIGLLANAVKEGRLNAVKKLLTDEQPLNDIQYHPLSSQQVYEDVLHDSIHHYKHYLNAIKQTGINDIASVLAKFAQYRLLCAVREGHFGVEGLNKQIELLLAKNKLIQLKNKETWYVGRPIMILRNSTSLGLYNGDIGITLMAEHDSSKLRVYFPFADGSIKGFSPFRLPEHETAYAMTIHKSQGSEFDHVNIILPTDYSPLLNRSLLYTAITRAKKTVSIYATEPILLQAVKSQTQRHSGLVNLLQNNH